MLGANVVAPGLRTGCWRPPCLTVCHELARLLLLAGLKTKKPLGFLLRLLTRPPPIGIGAVTYASCCAFIS